MPRVNRPLRSLPISLAALATLAALLAAADPAAAHEPPQPDAAAASHVVLDTTLGTMTIELLPHVAPQTVAQIQRLVAAGWYDGKPFYRVVAGHVIQAGDGGENDQPTVAAEFSDRPHVVGAVGLARDEDPDSGATEIYVCLAPRPHLDGRYTIFGQVVEGLDVLAAIGAVPVNEKWLGDEEPRVAFHEPVEPVVIERARLVGGEAAEAVDDEAGEAGAPPGAPPATAADEAPPATDAAAPAAPPPPRR
jgi:cyclophilin family peptidyl-prolyl cis-trans isomerase